MSLRSYLVAGVVACLLASTACFSPKPRLPLLGLAPPKLRCDHDNDLGCVETYSRYLKGTQIFTCDPAEDPKNCRQPLVVTKEKGPRPQLSYFSSDSLQEIFKGERGDVARDRSNPQEPPYQIGVALAGGGTKAASYAVGVLEGLSDSGLGERVDAISSVSGGSYAAVWYFSRLLDIYQIASEHAGEETFHRDLNSIFDDCLPMSYAALSAPSTDPALDPPLCNAVASQIERTGKDRYRYQSHLRGYQDVFEKDFDLTPNSPKVDSDSAWRQLVREIGWTLLQLPAHWFARGVFDWKDYNLSASGRSYFDGIARTYAWRPFNCELLLGELDKYDPRWKEPCLGDNGRPSPNTSAARGHTMSALANLYYNQKNINDALTHTRGVRLARIPFWIANTTAGVERNWYSSLFSMNRPDLEDAVFEFTPYSFGSRHFGRWVGTPADVELAQIAGASGAFLDAQQRTRHWLANIPLSALMDVFAANWGINVANPRWRDEVRSFHKWLPFPFYLAFHNSKTYDGAWIHLSDGGQSENTGAWSLVRRGARTIVIADEAHDGKGDFEDLCYLREHLLQKGLELRVPDLEAFEELCGDTMRGGKDQKHYDLWHWPVKYLHGCVTSDRGDTNCGKRDVEYFARLFILKPAIDLEKVRKSMGSCGPGDLSNPNATRCRESLEALRAEPGYEKFPAELYGFLVRNLKERKVSENSFPQNSTLWMTLNSSSTLFGAYRELARWQMSGIKEEVENPSLSTRPSTAVPLMR